MSARRESPPSADTATAVGLSIRRAQASDAAALTALYAELVSHPAVQVLPERLACLAQDPHTWVLVAELHGQVVATALLTLCQDVMFGQQPFGVLENLVTAETARGQGIGQRLLAHVDACCLAADCSKLMLLSAVERQDAHRFFERCGFERHRKQGFVKYRRHMASAVGAHGGGSDEQCDGGTAAQR